MIDSLEEMALRARTPMMGDVVGQGRAQLDDIDDAMVMLLKARLDVVTQIAAHKRHHQQPVVDAHREAHARASRQQTARTIGLNSADGDRLCDMLFAMGRAWHNASGE
jgi:chorismate mutase